MIKNIPKKNIDLNTYVSKWDDDWTKCVFCPAAWIATDPFLSKGRLSLREANTSVRHGVLDCKSGDVSEDLKELFEISEEEVNSLFYPDCDDDDAKEHKALFLEALDEIIFNHRWDQP